MAGVSRVLIYLIRRDLRLADNPIFHELAQLQQQSQRPFTHVLPVFVFSADQVEVSGFLRSGHKSPYPEARSRVSGLWRCGRLRAKFTAESVWDLKEDLQSIGSRLEVRVGSITDIVQSLLDGYKKSDDAEVHGLWMTGDEPWEEREQEKAARKVMEKDGKEFKLWVDEKYLVDDRDLPFDDAKDLSDVFTTFRKTVEPLREAPRRQLPRPDRIPPPPDFIPPQAGPFEVPDSLAGLIQALHNPIAADLEIPHMPDMPERVESAHPFVGGSKPGHARVHHLIGSGAMSAYKDTRNGLLGLDFSTRLSAWLALGCLTP
ncbi:cryptochrome dash like protein, partial [Teratosphaeria destructans]